MDRLPITDADRAWWQSLGKPDTVSDIVAASLADVGATPAPAEQPTEIRPQLPIATYRQLAGAAVFVVFGLLAVWALWPSAPTTDHRPPTTAGPAGVAAARPSAAPATTDVPAQVEAYAAPEGAQLGPIDASAPIAYRHSEYPEWGGVRWQGAVVWIEADHAPPTSLPDLARPTPAPTPVYVYVEPPCDVMVNPRYTARLDVSVDGQARGFVTGASCDSQALAQADADQRAAEMRASAPTPCPTWAGPPFVKPDCI